jgi:NodT family efflux transporter outer membrane factor (OMF) lipoprotein
MKRRTSIMNNYRRAMAVVVGVAVLLVGCTMSETVIPPTRLTVPSAFDQPPSAGISMPPESLARWWTVWRDPTLDGLIAAALEANTDIRIARSRVAEARSLSAIAESALYPTVSANGGMWGGEVDWRGRTLDMLAPKLSSGIDSHFLSLGASWEPDVFGGRNDDSEAARAFAASVEEQRNGTRMIVVADVAENYQEARGLQRRLAVLDGGIATLGQLQCYVEARFEAGQALSYDVALVRERLESMQAKRPGLVSVLDTRIRRLAVLDGSLPETAILLSDPGPFVVPSTPSGQIPSTVLERRPDVRARAALVRAQTARLRSAKTDLLPRFQIEFLAQDGHLHFSGIPGLGGTGGLLGLSVQLPIFTAGRIEANIAANDARLEAEAAEYDKAVLQALEDVEDAYGFRRGLDQRAIDQTRDLSTADLYENGNKTLQDVLSARLDTFDREDELIQTQMGQATATVQLYRALGGGWSSTGQISMSSKGDRE